MRNKHEALLSDQKLSLTPDKVNNFGFDLEKE